MSLHLISDEGDLHEELPLVLSVEEAARLLRIGRSAAYEQARIFRATGGREGLPVVAIVDDHVIPQGVDHRIPHPVLDVICTPSPPFRQ
jgi:hypothetical protein